MENKTGCTIPEPPPMPWTEVVHRRGIEHYEATGERVVEVTPQEFSALKREAQEQSDWRDRHGVQWPVSASVGDYLGFRVQIVSKTRSEADDV